MNEAIPESPDTIAWNRARTRKRWEVVSMIAAGVVVMVMFAVFASILTAT